jgi:signal peptidase II
LRILYFSFFVIVADQLSKFFVKGLHIPSLGVSIKGMNYGDSLSIIDNFFKLTFIENPGMAFGIEFGGKLLRSIFTLAASIFLVYLIFKNRNNRFYVRLSLAFILGGAVGNLFNRLFNGLIYGYAPLFYGNVVDFFHIDGPVFKLFGKTFYSLPIFNIADISIFIGFAMLILGYKKLILNKNQGVKNKVDSLEQNIESALPLNSDYSNIAPTA